jgi:hypothetical protein
MDVLHVCILSIWKQQISKLLRRRLVSLFIIAEQELWVTYSLSALSLFLTFSLSLFLFLSLLYCTDKRISGEGVLILTFLIEHKHTLRQVQTLIIAMGVSVSVSVSVSVCVSVAIVLIEC